MFESIGIFLIMFDIYANHCNEIVVCIVEYIDFYVVLFFFNEIFVFECPTWINSIYRFQNVPTKLLQGLAVIGFICSK